MIFLSYKEHDQRAGAGPNPHQLTPLVETVLNVIGNDSPTLCGIDVIIGDIENCSTKKSMQQHQRARNNERWTALWHHINNTRKRSWLHQTRFKKSLISTLPK
ncbi:uncharacterized protein LOC121836521 [Ixodes scapularis]|uniref:uncharacterized protein LOC121836521 n=1 Tax=Ixodes scapularis TaxID=6945 RepID=UPI001C3889E7|nr:uncharacterized protein LOC121836521 [Ixodes scapularis]